MNFTLMMVLFGHVKKAAIFARVVCWLLCIPSAILFLPQILSTVPIVLLKVQSYFSLLYFLPKMADTDLTSTILKYTDRHLGFPLLQHLGSLNIFNQDDIAKAMYELAKGTSMVDFALQLHQQAYPDEPAPTELQKQRENAEAQNERLASEVETVLNVIEDPTVADSLKQDKAQNLQWLEEHYKVCVVKYH